MLAMTNPVREYAWGSRTLLAGLRGDPPTAGPEAELWMGAHPAAPSLVAMPDGSMRALDELVRADPAGVLGHRVLDRHGARLPYLMKVIAAASPLSIQLHPSEQQARAGYAAEEAAGIPVDDPRRTFTDPFAKPELVVALQPFLAMVGLRPVAAMRDHLERVGADVAARLAGGPATTGPDVLGRLLCWPAGERPQLLTDAAAAAERNRDRGQEDVVTTVDPWTWVRRLLEAYPDDPAVLAPLLLQVMVLQPGEGLFLPAGVVHSYLSGLAVEVMGASDNVLRAGLTPKHVDVPAMVAMAASAQLSALHLLPAKRGDGVERWEPPVDTFALQRLTLGREPRALAPSGGPEILLCTAGAAVLTSGDERLRVLPGSSVFVAAGEATSAAGPATVFRCTVGADLVQPDGPAWAFCDTLNR